MLKKIYFIFVLLIGVIFKNLGNEARLLRFPAIYKDKLVFSYAGDLYIVGISGGTARRITSHEGYEIFPRFSPNGKKLAFTGQYDGNTEIYMIPSNGGVPKRLTYTATINRDDIADRMGPNNIAMAWTPDGKNITYRSRKNSFNPFIGSLFNVSIEGGLSKELPLATGGFCSYSPDGSKLAFNRVLREFRTWKYYRGGMADDIWIYDFKTNEVFNITNNPAQDIIPMWIDREIYFLSDRDRTMNLFVYNLDTKQIKKVTDFNDFDIKFPSHDNKSIVFENAGYIYHFDSKTKEYKKINIEIDNDLLHSRNEIKDVSKSFYSAWLSPEGKRIAISARGDIFSVPVENGITYNLTKSSGVHDRDAVWSPDGKYIAYVSDQSGEFEIFIINQSNYNIKQLTKNADTYKYNLKWSPDSKKILWTDRKLRLQYVDIETGKTTLVKKSNYIPIRNFNWSHDSKWVVFNDLTDNFFSIIQVFNTETKKVTSVTNSWFDSYDPVFSDDGKYIAFVSNRDFKPIYSSTEWNHAYNQMSRVYLITLKENSPSPFSPINDIVDLSEKKEDTKEKDSIVTVDIDNIENRIISLPIEVANYENVYVIKNKVYYFHVSDKNIKTLKLYDLAEKKETTVIENINAFSLSPDMKKIIILKQNDLYVSDLPTGSLTLDKPVNTSEMKVMVDLKSEWQQIYDESWRQMRDFFYDENMHGVDWKKMKEKYSVLLPYVAHRNDLTYVIGELIGELNAGHAYIQSGDRKNPKRIKTGLLGAEISKHASGYFIIDNILDGENWDASLRSPLQELGTEIMEGDFIILIDGTDLKNIDDLFQLLVGKAGKPVEIGFSKTPDTSDVTKHIVITIDDESDLYYYNWIKSNIEKVEKATKGEVGYIHIPDMGQNGLNQFAKYFYPQLNKKALIIDDRGNGGGNVSPMIIERLKREVIRQRAIRNIDIGIPMPLAAPIGPKVLLVNEYSASDGDLFAYAFKKFNLGPVIGKRTWGGVVGISGTLPFIDGGSLHRPEYASFSAEKSEWIIEGHGVDPDIVIDNNPYLEYKGKDTQLEKAIEIIKDLLKNYKPLPLVPKGPDKSK